MEHYTIEDFIFHLYRAEFNITDFTGTLYINYVSKMLNQEVFEKLFLEMLKQNNRNSMYIENVLSILSYVDLSNIKLDVTVFKTLVKKTDACVVDACLRFIEHKADLFTVEFIKQLPIEIKWLAEYRDEIVKDLQ